MIEVLGWSIAWLLSVVLFALAFTALCFSVRCLRYMFALWGYWLSRPPAGAPGRRPSRWLDD